MQNTVNPNLDVEATKRIDSYSIQCFEETPSKRGEEKPIARIGAFDLFNLFTANIIRSKEIFTR